MRAPRLFPLFVASMIGCGGGDGAPADAGSDAIPDLGPDATPDASPDAAPDMMAPITANVVFVTDDEHAANFGGLAQADAICQGLADAAGFPGTFVAWLSTSTVDAIDRMAGSRGWQRPDGKPFADTVADLADGNTFYPPRITSTGAALRGFTSVWSGTHDDGTHVDDQMCDDWTSNDAADSALFGRVGSGGTGFGSGAGANCSFMAHLLCFGTGRDVEVAPEPVAGRRAFVTDSFWLPGSGIGDADALCQSDANAGGLVGTFRAFLAPSGATIASRFTLTSAPWIRLDGLPITPSPAALFTPADRDAPILFLASGARITTDDRFWVGSEDPVDPTTVGTMDSTCGDWMSTTGSTGLSGAARNTYWARINGATCSQASTRLLCLEDM